jgi:hypothetical protein
MKDGRPQIDLSGKAGHRVQYRGTNVDVRRRLARDAGRTVCPGILMAGEVVVEAGRQKQDDSVKDDRR